MAEQLTVPFSDDQSDEAVRDDELIVDDGKDPAEKARRAESRKQRGQEREAERKRLAEEIKELREARARTERELAELRGFVAAKASPATPADGKDEFDRKLDAVYDRQQEAFTAAQAECQAAGGEHKLPPERRRHYAGIARALESEKAEIIAEKVIAQREPVQQQRSARQVWEQKYPEVYGNPKAFQYAEATWRRRAAVGDNVTPEVVEEIMEETRATFKLGPKRAPTQSERASMSGLPSGGGGGGGSSGSGIQMTKELRQMAVAAYAGEPGPDGKPMSEEQAVKKWVQTVGKDLRGRKVL